MLTEIEKNGKIKNVSENANIKGLYSIAQSKKQYGYFMAI